MKKHHVGYIYKIENNITGKVYIGQTYDDYEKRWNAHKRDAKRGTKKTKLVKDFVQYGIDTFTFSVLEEVYGYSGYYLDILETEYIKKYNSYYDGLNSNEGANATGNSDIKYVAIIVDMLIKEIRKADRDRYLIEFPRSEIWVHKAFIFLQTANILSYMGYSHISIDQCFNIYQVRFSNERIYEDYHIPTNLI